VARRGEEELSIGFTKRGSEIQGRQLYSNWRKERNRFSATEKREVKTEGQKGFKKKQKKNTSKRGAKSL